MIGEAGVSCRIRFGVPPLGGDIYGRRLKAELLTGGNTAKGRRLKAELRTIFRRARLQPDFRVRLTIYECPARPGAQASVMLHREFYADALANSVRLPRFQTGRDNNRRAAGALARSVRDRQTTSPSEFLLVQWRALAARSIDDKVRMRESGGLPARRNASPDRPAWARLSQQSSRRPE